MVQKPYDENSFIEIWVNGSSMVSLLFHFHTTHQHNFEGMWGGGGGGGAGGSPSGDIPVGVTLYICQHPSNNSNPNSKISLLFNARPPNMKFPGAKHVKLDPISAH